MKTITVSSYLDLNNQIITSSTTMKSFEYLLCLVILSNIQAQIKKDNENLGKISIHKNTLRLFLKKDTLRDIVFKRLVHDLYDNHCFNLQNGVVLDKFFLSLDYNDKILNVEYNIDKITQILSNTKKFTQVDVQYMCQNLAISKNALHMYVLICFMKSAGILKIKKDTLLYILLKDYKTDYPTYTLTRDIKRALSVIKDIIGDYNVTEKDNVYTITFQKFKFIKSKTHKKCDIL